MNIVMKIELDTGETAQFSPKRFRPPTFIDSKIEADTTVFISVFSVNNMTDHFPLLRGYLQ